MGRSKLRVNKKPPPKSIIPKPEPTDDPPLPLPLPLSLPLPPTSSSGQIDINDPAFRSAWDAWTTSAIGRLDQLPKLTQSQLNAIAGAAAGIAPKGLNGNSNGNGNGNVGLGGYGISAEGLNGLANLAGMGNIGGPNGNLGIDLPASLAALFEAKLTLDREKAKLVRMQTELKGYKDAATANTITSVNGKGKQIASTEEEEEYDDEEEEEEDGEGECTCGRRSGEEYDPCGCDCHEDYDSGILDDPERLDEAVRELFNWIKAVVWTIEQAALVAGKGKR